MVEARQGEGMRTCQWLMSGASPAARWKAAGHSYPLRRLPAEPATVYSLSLSATHAVHSNCTVNPSPMAGLSLYSRYRHVWVVSSQSGVPCRLPRDSAGWCVLAESERASEQSHAFSPAHSVCTRPQCTRDTAIHLSESLRRAHHR